MENYRFCFRYTGRCDNQYECDADAMVEARKLLATQQKLQPKEEVWVWCQNPAPSKTYRFVAAYK